MFGRGPPAYNDKPLADGALADGIGPMHRAVDGPMAVADGQPGWPAPAALSRPGFHGPVAHRQMDGTATHQNDLMAHRGLVIHFYCSTLTSIQFASNTAFFII